MVKNFQIEKRHELYLECFMLYSWYTLETELIITNRTGCEEWRKVRESKIIVGSDLLRKNEKETGLEGWIKTSV